MSQNERKTSIKQRLTSLRFRILLPVIILVILVITLLTTLFSRAYIQMIMKQEQEVNAVGFSTVSNSVAPLINASVSEARGILSDDRVASYARHQYSSESELVHARIDCRDFLRSEIVSRDRVFGLLFMRKDGSLFGVLPKANLFLDDPNDNPLPKGMREQILDAPLGQVVWVGPVSEAELCGFENDGMSQSIMIAAWKSVNVSYGECYAMLLMDDSIFDDLFAALQDGKSVWRLFAQDQMEIWHSGEEACQDPGQLIDKSNDGEVFLNADGLSICSFSMAMDSPAWTLVREVSMEGYEQVVRGVTRTITVFGGMVLAVVLVAYELWLRRFMRQFQSLLNGIVRMGEGDLESTEFEPSSITEFKQMQGEIDRTRVALGEQMETIRRMEREAMEQENAKREQERIAQELQTAREIQASALPQTFPAFPEHDEFDLFASMTPAKEVGGDFYDFFLIDSNHLALVIADVSGKGIPAALFMMSARTLIRNELMTGCDPATALTRVNLALSEHNSSSMFVTVWLAVLEISTGKGMACNAGHENPGLRRAGGQFELLEYRHNLLVGAMAMARYQNREFELRPGDCLFVYTDGASEANDASENMFGEERLLEALNRHADASPEELVCAVRDAIDQFTGDAPQFDDITMLCFRLKDV